MRVNLRFASKVQGIPALPKEVKDLAQHFIDNNKTSQDAQQVPLVLKGSSSQKAI